MGVLGRGILPEMGSGPRKGPHGDGHPPESPEQRFYDAHATTLPGKVVTIEHGVLLGHHHFTASKQAGCSSWLSMRIPIA